MLPWVLGGAALGGLQAYGQSGGDIGKTLLGAGLGGGLGAFVPGAGNLASGAVTRFAGARLAPFLGSSMSAANAAAAIPGFGRLIPEGATLAQKAAIGAELTKNAAALQKGIGGLTKTGIGLGAAALIPTAAAGVAGAVPQLFGGGARGAQNALSGSMQLLGAGQQLTAPGATGEVNLAGPPSLGQYGPDSYMDVAAFNSPARGQMLRGEMEARSQLEQMKTLMPYQYEMITKAQNADLLRQGAGAQLRTRLAQGAQAMAQAQLGAQALAQQGNQAMLQAATMRGGYV
jgi:hypothetical protein